MTRWLLVLALVSCAKKSEAPPPPPDDRPKPTITEAEATRGRDACKAYVDKVCKCADTSSPLVKECELSRALPDALRVSREVSLSPDSSAKDIALAEDSARKTIKECFEQLAKLPTLGCR